MLDELDKTILNRVQSDFPIAERPFRIIADELGLSEEDVISRMQQLRKTGIIRRLGGNFGPEKLGFVSTLCAAMVPQDKIASFAKVVNRLPGVTHNYQRGNNRYNIWFTIIAASQDSIAQHLEQIQKETGITEILNLPATEVYKIKAHFDL